MNCDDIPTTGPDAQTPDDPRVYDDLGTGLPSQALARLLLSGLVGLRLYYALGNEFPAIRRAEVFFGIALAWTDMQAALIAVELELADLRRQLDGRSAP